MTAVQDLKGLAKRPKAEELRQLAAMWRPYRTFAARLLWHYYGMKRGRGGTPLTDK
jgi:DNA-3-methyladenine glycosylase II